MVVINIPYYAPTGDFNNWNLLGKHLKIKVIIGEKQLKEFLKSVSKDDVLIISTKNTSLDLLNSGFQVIHYQNVIISEKETKDLFNKLFQYPNLQGIIYGSDEIKEKFLSSFDKPTFKFQPVINVQHLEKIKGKFLIKSFSKIKVIFPLSYYRNDIKNVQLAVKIAKLMEDNDDVDFYLIGSNLKECPYLQNVPKNLKFSFLPKPQFYYFLKEMNICIIPSKSDCFPTSLVEAMFFNCYPIVSNVREMYKISYLGKVIDTNSPEPYIEAINQIKFHDIDFSELENFARKFDVKLFKVKFHKWLFDYFYDFSIL